MVFEKQIPNNIFNRRDYTIIISALLCVANAVVSLTCAFNSGFLFITILGLYCLLLPVVFYLKYAPIILSVFFFMYTINLASDYVLGEVNLVKALLSVIFWGILTSIVVYRRIRHSWVN